MKKIFFLTALLCASLMSFAATQYCGEATSNEKFTFSLTHVSSNTYKIQFDAVSDVEFGGSAVNVNCGVNQTAGAGITFGNDGWVFTDKSLKQLQRVQFRRAFTEIISASLRRAVILL